MRFSTSIIPSCYMDALRARVEEQAESTRDPREAYEVIHAQEDTFSVRVRGGLWAERDLVFEGKVGDGSVDGDFRYGHGACTEPATKAARLCARLTSHLLLGALAYLVALGLFSLLGGKGAWFPLIAPAILWGVEAAIYFAHRAGARRRFLSFLKNELDTLPEKN